MGAARRFGRWRRPAVGVPSGPRRPRGCRCPVRRKYIAAGRMRPACRACRPADATRPCRTPHRRHRRPRRPRPPQCAPRRRAPRLACSARPASHRPSSPQAGNPPRPSPGKAPPSPAPAPPPRPLRRPWPIARCRSTPDIHRARRRVAKDSREIAFPYGVADLVDRGVEFTVAGGFALVERQRGRCLGHPFLRLRLFRDKLLDQRQGRPRRLAQRLLRVLPYLLAQVVGDARQQHAQFGLGLAKCVLRESWEGRSRPSSRPWPAPLPSPSDVSAQSPP